MTTFVYVPGRGTIIVNINTVHNLPSHNLFLMIVGLILFIIDLGQQVGMYLEWLGWYGANGCKMLDWYSSRLAKLWGTISSNSLSQRLNIWLPVQMLAALPNFSHSAPIIGVTAYFEVIVKAKRWTDSDQMWVAEIRLRSESCYIDKAAVQLIPRK